jgi:hypothetical protein
MISNLLIKIKEFDAHGGPSVKTMGADRNEMTPTESGRFVIAKIEKHVSSGRYLWSGVPWGAGLKFINNVTYIDISNKGLWQKLTVYRPIWLKEYQTEAAVTNAIIDYWKVIAFTTYAGNNIALYGMQIPDRWVFNDFGHISVKYFRDKNHNGILDKNESILGDFIHTTPSNEAVSFYNSTRQASQSTFAVDLPGSHGCIHVKPEDVNTMIGSGFLKKGEVIVVHPYSEKVMPATIKPDRYTRKGYEAHFFPGLFKIAIYKST